MKLKIVNFEEVSHEDIEIVVEDERGGQYKGILKRTKWSEAESY